MIGVNTAIKLHNDHDAITDDNMDIVLAAKEDFEAEIMPKTRKTIREMIAEADPKFVRTCRTEYLKSLMSDAIVDTWQLLARYEEAVRKDTASINRLCLGERIHEKASEVVSLQGKIIAMSHPERKGQITDEMIKRAKEHPFQELLEFRRNMARCPFHEDRTPSMYLYAKDNRVHCFSCHRNLDTIGFVAERDGLTFVEAVKCLT
jgi:hypothetical protein